MLSKGRGPGTIAFCLLLALGACASTASAEPLSMTFTEDRANVGVQLSDAPMFAAPDTAPFAAQIDPGSGSITGGDLQVPPFFTHLTGLYEGDVTVDFDIGVITGSFNQATGALTLAGEAGGTLTSEGKECVVSTDPAVLTLTTEGNSGGTNPRSGALFTAGLSGAGAIAGQWADMHATPISGDTTFCNNVEGRIGGPGGIWLVQKGKVVPPSTGGPEPPKACVVPKVIGKRPKAAKRMIRAAGCKVGRVHKPKRPKGLKGRWVLVVKSTNPAAGASPASGKVRLRLGPKP